MRWSHLLFTQGFGTRRECEALVAGGRVAHGGAAIDDPEAEADVAEGFAFEVDGRAWPWHERALILLHKPAGYECSQRPGAHPSVMTLLPAPLRQRGKGGVQAVGRLDADTTGALLLTDDGPLLHRLTSPKHHVPKVYEVTAKHAVDDAQIARLLEGVVLRDEAREARGDPAPVRALAAERTGATTLRLTLGEGKYHQVKRMLAAVGNRCEALHRSAIGSLTLPDELAPGQWCWLGSEDRRRLLA
ncbi:MAG TPA: 16S rRNA pseudouridine(516) synthase [Methylibium sp.]|uniref:16S rRNA pseudouridine(516) synthase n=1 Tax=Methylibium sp. TaxID=2067992 RepID=UPI002DB5D7AC|nr:16S rRNA pseudouridine(516) synthase [Methylibium sp.]HEU4458764.1 16S rRNA pseudouridine(516) synthase [Methylibium sp.]